jgi:Uma2 family endonuclease
MESVQAKAELKTAVDLYNMPDHGGRNELVQGEVVPMSPASTKHGMIVFRLAFEVGLFTSKNQLGEVYAAETGFTIQQNPDTVRAPDVAFVAQSRIPEEGVPETGFWAIAPDLVAEVVSPNDRMTEIQDKVTDYLAAGVRLVWVVDPKTETVTVYQSLKQVKVLVADDVLEGEDVLPGFELSLKKLFS